MSGSRLLRFFLALAVLTSAGYALRGYVTDDSYIHLRYATNLLERGEFSFNPGESTYGATSPLWILGLALLLKLGLAPLTALWTLGVASGLAAVLMMDAILARLPFPSRWKTLVLLLMVSDAWFLRWTFSGMETPLATFFLLVLLWPLFSGRDVGWSATRAPLWRRYLGWGVGAGLAGMIRPEFLLLVPLALPWLLWFEYYRASATGGASLRYRARPHAPLRAALLGWAVVTVPWFVYAQVAFGRMTPGTAAAKSSELTLNPMVIWPYFWRTVQQLAAVQGLLWMGIIVLIVLVIVRNSDLGRLADESIHDHDDDRSRRLGSGVGAWSVWGPVATLGIAGTWAAVLIGGYAFKQVWIISRYVSPLAPVLLLAMALIGEWLLGGTTLGNAQRRIGGAVISVVVAGTLVANGWLLTTQVVPHARALPQGIESCYGGFGRWLAANTPDDAVVAALDIGALGYVSDRKVLDLMGLVSPEILEIGRTQGFQAMVESGAWLTAKDAAGRPVVPDYLVDRSEGLPRWDDRLVNGYRFELLDTCTISGLGIREPQPWTVALYRLWPASSSVSDSAGG